MDDLPVATNRMPARYREVAVATVDVDLVENDLRRHFEGREAYRRTGYIVVHARNRDEVALLQVQTASR